MAERWLSQQGAQGRYPHRASQDILQSLEVPTAERESATPPSIRRSGLRSTMDVENSPGRSERAFRTGNERLYEAYNDLHSLAQDFEKPFDAPAILVVGHQTDGKSALVEALMGFQFNHVGGGTKTRRPITLHMKYNSACVQPVCYLVTEEFGEQEVTLEELQDYIENENARLDREGQFWQKEIVVKIEYKYCPNLTIIDTPGLISAAPGKRNSSLQTSARQVEQMVRMKMDQKEYIILCLEDSNDWSNATTRRLVMQVDPTLSRTVVVSTKLDTRIPQFARAQDVEMYLRPPARLLEPSMLGGSPFFTSVPSGRVGNSKDALFRSNEHFMEAVGDREAMDVAELESRLGRRLDRAERARIGVGQLRRFLEHLLQRRYLENVPTIVPVLEKEYRNASRRLEETQEELGNMHPDKLKDKGRIFREAFLAKLQLLLRGTVAAPPERFGETLADEHIRGGAFVGPDNKPVIVNEQLPNSHMRLFGGAQYHRAMAEFRAGIGQINCPDISREEIVNACGIDDFHDGVNYTRTACVIAVAKARELFEPFLHQLGYRLAHIQRRMLPIAMHLLQKDGQFLNGHDLFLKRVGAAYHAFIEDSEKGCRQKCMEDLQSTTRYVTWSLHTKSRSSLKAMLSKVTTPGGKAKAAAAAAGGGGGEGEEPVRPGSMVWLIQRDFLRGKGLAQTLQDALQPVANPHADPGLEQLNRIRLSLQQLARNSTAVGLPQPHLDRTRLCEMTDASLEPAYVKKREELRALVRQLAAPKVVRGTPLTGKGLAALIRKVVTALNEREIPNAGSLVEYFNRELVAACTQLYIKRMEALRLPVEDKALLAASAAARDAAAAKFEREKFGRQVESLRGALDAALARELAVVQGANAAESARTCERAEMTCEEVLDKEARQRLPSMGRFETKYEQCAKRFRQACVGPALTNNLDRLKRAWEREHSRFALAYNERLLNGLMLLSLACIVAFRFVVRVQLGESLGWVAFIFLQVYPKTFLASEATMYDSAWWRWLVAAWEHVVFNPLLDLQSTGLPLGAVAAAAALTRRWWVPVARVWWARRRLRRRKQLAGALQEGRDLNV